MSEYSELIKNYAKIRDYIRDFYIYGFRSRDDYSGKSNRSYDNEKRRIESYLGDILYFRQEEDGKKVFLTADSAELLSNPFYKSFKTKSFTKNDISLHFAILYVLKKHGALTLKEMLGRILKEVLDFFEGDEIWDEATLRNKLKEYLALGILKSEKVKGKLYFSLSETPDLDGLFDAINFFSENFPLGVVGSFLLDRFEEKNRIFTSKHKYLLEAVDSEVICALLSAIREQKKVVLTSYGYRRGKKQREVLPLKVALTTQSGRNYLMCYEFSAKHFLSCRIDSIENVRVSETPYASFRDKKQALEERLKKTWGVYVDSSEKPEWLKVYISVREGEDYIVQRLQKEKRTGVLEKAGENLYCLSLETYDLEEIRPWLRTFIGRIEKLECSQKSYVRRFFADIEEMKKLYGGEKL